MLLAASGGGLDAFGSADSSRLGRWDFELRNPKPYTAP